MPPDDGGFGAALGPGRADIVLPDGFQHTGAGKAQLLRREAENEER